MTAGALGIVGAMLALGALAIGLMIYLGTIRVPLVLKGEVKMRDIAVDRGGWPEREHRVANAVDNQFQLPVLFYAGVPAWRSGSGQRFWSCCSPGPSSSPAMSTPIST